MLPDTAVIIVSNLTGSAYTERAKAAYAFAYISKDAVHDELPLTASVTHGLIAYSVFF